MSGIAGRRRGTPTKPKSMGMGKAASSTTRLEGGGAFLNDPSRRSMGWAMGLPKGLLAGCGGICLKEGPGEKGDVRPVENRPAAGRCLRGDS